MHTQNSNVSRIRRRSGWSIVDNKLSKQLYVAQPFDGFINPRYLVSSDGPNLYTLLLNRQCDDDVGSAGALGLGTAAIDSCGEFGALPTTRSSPLQCTAYYVSIAADGISIGTAAVSDPRGYAFAVVLSSDIGLPNVRRGVFLRQSEFRP